MYNKENGTQYIEQKSASNENFIELAPQIVNALRCRGSNGCDGCTLKDDEGLCLSVHADALIEALMRERDEMLRPAKWIWKYVRHDLITCCSACGSQSYEAGQHCQRCGSIMENPNPPWPVDENGNDLPR